LPDFDVFSGLLSAFFADFFGSASFFLSFFSEDFESADAAADFFADEVFMSFNSLLAFEGLSFDFFSSLATFNTPRSVPVPAHLPVNYSQADL